MNKFTIFILASAIYAIIDILWNFLIAFPFLYDPIHQANGTDLSFQRALPEAGILGIVGIVAFFLLIGYANARFAIAPALESRSVGKAALNGFILGCAAYATFAAPFYLQVDTWPFVLVPIDILIGGFLSVATSGIITAIVLRLRPMRQSAEGL